MTREPDWLSLEDVVFFHGQVVAMFGGAREIRDVALLESALSRPRNAFAYGSKDWFVLASVYAHGLVKNRPFVDGNKRVAFVAARVFLGLNGIVFNPPEVEAVVMVEGLASGALTPEEFTDWLRKHSRRRRRPRRSR